MTVWLGACMCEQVLYIKYYSKSRFFSSEARGTVQLPDLQPLPMLRQSSGRAMGGVRGAPLRSVWRRRKLARTVMSCA